MRPAQDGPAPVRSHPTEPPRPHPHPAEPVHSITSASGSHTEDLNARVRRYLVSMAIRTACVLLVFVVDSPIRWVFAVLAVILPYVAVVMANAAGSRRTPGPAPVPVSRPALPATVDLGDYLDKSDIRSDASAERPSGESHERTA